MIARTRAPELIGAGGWIGVERPLSLQQDLRGKVVMLDFWTFCCINCIRILEELRPIERRFPDELMVIGVHSPKFPHEHDHEAVRQAVARHGVEHPVLDDPYMETWTRYGVRAWPTIVIVDPEGYVVGMGSGEGLGPSVERLVEQLVTEHDRRGTLHRGPLPAQLLSPRRPASPLAFPGKVVSDGADRLAISDTGNDRVLITDRLGRVLQVVEGLREPQGVRFEAASFAAYGAVDNGTNEETPDVIVVCETGADRLTRVDLVSGRREVLVEGIAAPWDVILEPDGVYLIAEAGRHRLWRCEPYGTNPTPVAGGTAEGLRDGPGPNAHLAQPSGLARVEGGAAFVDAESSALRVIGDDAVVRTLVGQGLFEWGTSDGFGELARLQHPLGVAATPGTPWGEGPIYVADTFNSRLRVWRGGELQTLAVAGLDEPGGLDLLPDGRLVVADTNNHRIVRVDPGTGSLEEIPIRGLPEGREFEGQVLGGGSGGQGLGSQDQEWWGPIQQEVEFTEPLAVPAGSRLTVPFSVDIGNDWLDPSASPPVRVVVDADPPTLLGNGPRSWGFHEATGAFEIDTGAPGEGTLVVDVAAAACDDYACRVHTSRIRYPLIVR